MSTFSSLRDAAQKAQKAVSNTVDSTSKAASSAAKSTAKAVTSTVESKTKLVIDTAIDTKDSAIGGVVKGVGNTWDAMTGVMKTPLGDVVGLGLTIGMIVAPVPVGVGLSILWLLDSQMKGSQARIENHLVDSKQRRTRERVIGLLQKYGEIPETAVLKTSMLNVKMNSKTGEVTGHITSGDFKGQTIEDLDFHGLCRLIQSCDDDLESKQVLEALENYRITRLQGIIVQ